MMKRKTQKKGTRKVPNKRQKILRAAEKEFACKGFAGARMERIARTAGLDKATLYHYFRTKQDIYNAVLVEVTRAFTELSSRGFDHDTDPGGELTEFVGILLDFLNTHRSFALILRLAFAEPGRWRKSSMHGALSPLISRVRTYIQDNMATGEMRKTDPEHTLYSLYEILFGYFTLSPEAARMFFDQNPYTRDMLHRRKAHVADMIRRVLVPERPHAA